MSDLYDADIVVWSEEQGALLRRVAAGERLNDTHPDWENIIEEIESVGRSQVEAVESLLFQALVHWLKAEAWPASVTAPSWQGDSRGFRLQARRRFAPSMRHKLDVADLYSDARKALPEIVDGQPPSPVPADCPFTLDQLLGDDRL